MDNNFVHGHALLVGVGGDLPNTVDDATAIANILKDPERCAYPAEQVQLLTGEQATRDALLSSLDDLCRRANNSSTVILYFSGHGYQVTSPIRESYYLITHGHNLNRLDQTTVRGDEFTEKLRALRSQKVLVLLDCCHAGGLAQTKAPGLELTKSPFPPETKNLLAEGTGRVLIASSQKDELSYAGKPYSAFTLALLESLCGSGVAQMDGYVRVADMAMHAREMVPQRTMNKQHPILNFEQAENFVVAYYASGDLRPKELPFEEEPEIEPNPGAWTLYDQRSQTIHGSQTIIEGDVRSTFYQPHMNVGGNVRQVQGDLYEINNSESTKKLSRTRMKKRRS